MPRPLKPTEELIEYILTESSVPCEPLPLRLTPIDLAADASKVFRSLAVSQDVWVDHTHAEGGVALSVGVSAWEVRVGLLSSLETLGRLYLEAGASREAFCYAREGVMAAKTLLLKGW